MLFSLGSNHVMTDGTIEMDKFLQLLKGWVMELGVICPSLNVTFGMKRVKNERL